MPDDLLVTVKAKVASDDAMTMMSASETRSLLRALVVRCEQAEAALAAERIENARLHKLLDRVDAEMSLLFPREAEDDGR